MGRGQQNGARQTDLVHLALCLAAFAHTARLGCVSAQQLTPFLGNGDVAPADPVNVHISTYLDRLLAVDDKNYLFEAVLWIYASWRDPRVTRQVQDNQAKMLDANYTCEYPCQSTGKAFAGGCCDGVWQPFIAITNVKYLPQDRVVRYAMGWNPSGDNVWYWRTVHAVYYTAMNLRAFPFDTQQLLVQMEVPQSRAGWAGALVQLLPSVTGEQLFTARPPGSDLVSGWKLEGVQLYPYNYSLCQMPLKYAESASAPDDPSPLVPPYLAPLQGQGHAQCAAVIDAQPNPSQSVYWRNSLMANISGQPIPVSGLNVIVIVQRLYTPYVITAIVPICATTWLAFMVFFLPRRDMPSRLSAVMGLFLALAAIQFVIASQTPFSSYTTALQQLILLSYICLVLVAAENLVIWHLTVYHKDKERIRRHYQALKRYQEQLVGVAQVANAWRGRTRERAAAGADSTLDLHAPKSVDGLAAPERATSAFADIVLAAQQQPGSAAGGQPPPAAGLPAADAGQGRLGETPTIAPRTPAGDLHASSRSRGRQALAAASLNVAGTPAAPVLDADGRSSRRPAADAAADSAGLLRQGDVSLLVQGDHATAGSEANPGHIRRSSSSSSSSSSGGAESAVSKRAAVASGVHGEGQPDPAAPWRGALASVASDTPEQRALWRHPWDRLLRKYRLHMNLLDSDPDFADYVAYTWNKWLAIGQFFAYNACVVLIFSLNWAIYG